MDCYEQEVRELENSLHRKLDNLESSFVGFYGSSSIRLWETLEQDFPSIPVVNIGFGGSTIPACIYFFDRLITPFRPDSLVIYVGDNDLGDGRTPQQLLASFQQLLAKINLELGPIPIAYISIKPSQMRWHIDQSIRLANRLIQTEIEKYQHIHFIDIYAAMLNEFGRPRSELYMEDGLHLSPAGYLVWKEIVKAHEWAFIPPQWSRTTDDE